MPATLAQATSNTKPAIQNSSRSRPRMSPSDALEQEWHGPEHLPMMRVRMGLSDALADRAQFGLRRV